jgi:selenide,water dikinase
MESATRPIRLTQTVKKGGCAAKVAAVELRRILSGVAFPPAPPELLVDGRLFDDAAVYRVGPDLAIVQTLDFFTPIVDSPYDFGRVAAANAISDVYAMGARPVLALAILAFPLGELDNACVTEVMNGACDVLAKSGAALAGGHSIDDDTLKFGLSVTGLVHPERVWTNAGAQPGDALILTKGLGTGTLSAALKRGEIGEAEMRPAIESMAQLNDAASLLASEDMAGAVRAATDVTGFGLAGHAMQLARASGARLVFRAAALPRLPGAVELLQKGVLTKAHKTNKDYVSTSASWPPGLPEADRLLFFDPQTSGGLLLSVDPERAQAALACLRERFASAAIVGRVERPETSTKNPPEAKAAGTLVIE